MARYGRDYGQDRTSGMRGYGQGGYGNDYGAQRGGGYGGMGSDGGTGGGESQSRGGYSGFGTGGGAYDSDFGYQGEGRGGYGNDSGYGNVGGGYGGTESDWGGNRSRGFSNGYGGPNDIGRGYQGGAGAYGGYGYNTQGGRFGGYEGGGGYGQDRGGAGYTGGQGGYGGQSQGGYGGGWTAGTGRGDGGDELRRMRASDVMTENPETVTPETTLADAARKMRDLDVGIIPVVESESSTRLRGVLTDRDITIRAVADGLDAKTTRVRDVMTTEVETCNKNDSLREVMSLMEREQVRRVPITDREGRLVGIVAQADVATDLDSPASQRRIADTLESISEPGRPRAAGANRGSQNRGYSAAPRTQTGGNSGAGLQDALEQNRGEGE